MKWGCLLLLCAGVAWGQSDADVNAHAWLMYFGDHPVTQRWGVHLEGQWRRADVGTEWQQLLLRPGVNYTVNRHLVLTAGYGYVRSYPYGDRPAPRSFPEHRVFEQALVKHGTGPLAWQHRLRLEQRWVGVSSVLGGSGREWENRHRFRYLLRTDVPLSRAALSQGGWYVGLYNEVFLGFGAHRGPQALDQNRAYAALGYHRAPWGKIEAGYLHQYVPQRNGVVVEHNHTLQVAIYSALPFGRRKQQ